ncbi:MAG TPA: hypothetical protein VJT81_06775 [Burkholderiales bacterium]|nr:hypothetical protein [Burkholderiales bacterium]
MTPIEFDGFNVTLAKDQPEYLPLPAHRGEDGIVTTCWQLSIRERFKVLFAGRLWLQQMTFDQPLQPQRPSVERPLPEPPRRAAGTNGGYQPIRRDGPFKAPPRKP